MKQCNEFPNDWTESPFPEDHFEPWIELNPDHLAWNLTQIRTRFGSIPIIADLRANAYGHGLVEIAGSLAQFGVDHFAVTNYPEAACLRRHRINGMILNLGIFSPCEAPQIVKYDISQTVDSNQVQILSHEAVKQNKQANVHIEVDTGAGGFGVPPDKALHFIRDVSGLRGIRVEGIMTTLLSVPEDAAAQLKIFSNLCDAFGEKGFKTGFIHASGFDVLIDFPGWNPDVVHAGGSLLGLEPVPDLNLKPVCSLKSRVMLTKQIPAGSKIGWRNETKIETDTLFAAVPVGYYDGYPPNALNKAEVLIKGIRYPVKGFISADHTTIDITGSTDIEIGDEVVLVGTQGNHQITNGELAAAAGGEPVHTAGHINPHLPRLIKKANHRWTVISVGSCYTEEYGPDFPANYFRPWIELSMSNLARNIKETRNRVGQRPIMAVVKSNVYGHGLLEISKEMETNGIRHLAVVKTWEAVSLRQNNINGIILNLGAFSRDEAKVLVKYEISQSVFSGAVDILAGEARKQGKRARVHIKIDTGLGRVGVTMEEAPDFIKKVASMPGIVIEGVFTVLTGPETVPRQLKDFASICDAAEADGVALGFRHAASSKHVSSGPESAYLDMVRPGNCLYGLEPLNNMNLKPVLSLNARVAYLKRISPGTPFYRRYCSGSEKSETDVVLAVVPLGTVDGYPLNKSGNMQVLISGNRCLLKGPVSSYYISVDVTGLDDIYVGSEVILIGRQGSEEITNAELSEHSGQSVYRTPVYLNPRLPRIPI